MVPLSRRWRRRRSRRKRRICAFHGPAGPRVLNLAFSSSARLGRRADRPIAGRSGPGALMDHLAWLRSSTAATAAAPETSPPTQPWSQRKLHITSGRPSDFSLSAGYEQAPAGALSDPSETVNSTTPQFRCEPARTCAPTLGRARRGVEARSAGVCARNKRPNHGVYSAGKHSLHTHIPG